MLRMRGAQSQFLVRALGGQTMRAMRMNTGWVRIPAHTAAAPGFALDFPHSHPRALHPPPDCYIEFSGSSAPRLWFVHKQFLYKTCVTTGTAAASQK
jgi:hypothetical protein